jgi:hypothetical protein
MQFPAGRLPASTQGPYIHIVRIDDGPRYAAVYTIAGDWVYDTPEFQAVKGFMEFEPHVSNFARLRLAPLSPHSESGSSAATQASFP